MKVQFMLLQTEATTGGQLFRRRSQLLLTGDFLLKSWPQTAGIMDEGFIQWITAEKILMPDIVRKNILIVTIIIIMSEFFITTI